MKYVVVLLMLLGVSAHADEKVLTAVKNAITADADLGKKDGFEFKTLNDEKQSQEELGRFLSIMFGENKADGGTVTLASIVCAENSIKKNRYACSYVIEVDEYYEKDDGSLDKDTTYYSLEAQTTRYVRGKKKGQIKKVIGVQYTRVNLEK